MAVSTNQNSYQKAFVELVQSHIYYSTRKTSAIWNLSAGCWAIMYCVIHTKYSPERTHAYLRHTSRPGDKHLCFALLKYFVIESSKTTSRSKTVHVKHSVKTKYYWIFIVIQMFFKTIWHKTLFSNSRFLVPNMLNPGSQHAA